MNQYLHKNNIVKTLIKTESFVYLFSKTALEQLREAVFRETYRKSLVLYCNGLKMSVIIL